MAFGDDTTARTWDDRRIYSAHRKRNRRRVSRNRCGSNWWAHRNYARSASPDSRRDIGRGSGKAAIGNTARRTSRRLVLLTKGVPIEATAILAREFPERLTGALSAEELRQAQSFPREPGISVLRDAQIALAAGKVTAMHDPTEGGLVTALWELAQASGRKLWFDSSAVPVPTLAARVCRVFGLDPLRAIASGGLLLNASKTAAVKIRRALESDGIVCAEIGGVDCGPHGVWAVSRKRHRRVKPPLRDEIARVFDPSKYKRSP